MGLSPEAKEAKKRYMKEWREKNREHYNSYIKEWKKRNPEKVQKHQENYWNKKAEGGE